MVLARTSLLTTFESTLKDRIKSNHYHNNHGNEDNFLPYMDEVVDLCRIYESKEPNSRPAIIHAIEKNRKCDASLGINLKFEDDDYDRNNEGDARRGIKKRCPKEDIKCRAPFAKPKSVKVNEVVMLEELVDFSLDTNLCVTSLPDEACQNYLPYISSKKFRSRFEAFRDEIFGEDYQEAVSSGFIAVHLRRRDRCGYEHQKHSNVYKMGACGDVTKWISKIKKRTENDDKLVYVATDSKEQDVIYAIKMAGFRSRNDLFGQYRNGVVFDDELLTDLDIFLIELDMLVYADTSIVVSTTNTVADVVTNTRKWLGLSDVQIMN